VMTTLPDSLASKRLGTPRPARRRGGWRLASGRGSHRRRRRRR
jgi:hypothetical protein